MASSLLERHFLLLICNAPPQAGRDVQSREAPAQIPESEECIFFASFGLLCRKDPAGAQGMCKVAKRLRKSLRVRSIDSDQMQKYVFKGLNVKFRLFLIFWFTGTKRVDQPRERQANDPVGLCSEQASAAG